MKKPDRFTRMVDKLLESYREFDDFLTDNRIVKADDAVQLLRHEHAWFRRMVSRELRLTKFVYTSSKNLCEIILKQLEQRWK